VEQLLYNYYNIASVSRRGSQNPTPMHPSCNIRPLDETLLILVILCFHTSPFYVYVPKHSIYTTLHAVTAQTLSPDSPTISRLTTAVFQFSGPGVFN
jgi:hypothetical protein